MVLHEKDKTYGKNQNILTFSASFVYLQKFIAYEKENYKSAFAMETF